MTTTTDTPEATADTAAELREAARLMRQHAQAATPAPWAAAIGKWEGEQYGAVLGRDSSASDPATWIVATGRRTAEQVHPDFDARHIAGMHPGVAEALADLLETVASCGCEEGDDHWPEKAAALKVARAVLGTTAGSSAQAAEPGSATCDAEKPGDPAPGGYPWMCTATPGHAGDHAERDEDGKVLAEWPQTGPEGEQQ